MKLNSDEKNQRHGEVLLTKVTHLLYGTIFLLIGIFVLSACGSNDETKGSTSDGSFIDRDAPKLSVSSSVLSFTEVPVGSENRQDLRISNTGVGPLHISNIRLVENDEDDLVEFHRSSNWATNLTLNRGESREISVIYRPLNNVSDSGYIELTSNDPTAPTVLVQLQTPSLAPRIFSPEVVRFNRVPAGQVARQNTEVINIGQLPLRIDDIILTGSEDFTISFPHRDSDASDHPDNDLLSWPDTLAPDSSFPVRVTFSPQSDDPSSSELIFLTNDPLTEEYTVSLSGNSNSPCLRMSHEHEINFGESSIGQATHRTIVVENCSSTSELRIHAIGIEDDEHGTFLIRDNSLPGSLPDETAVLAPRETTSFALTFTPERHESSEATLMVQTDDPVKANLRIPIVGVGTDNRCPVAIAEARLVGTERAVTELTTLPLNTVELTGANSFDSDGNIESYQWSIISRPTDSVARLLPSTTVMEPQLYLDLAGTYTIELTVYDNQGLANCDPALVTIFAVPQDDIHVQLVWDAPAVANPTEGYGTDLDLHYLHPLGRWNQAPYDIFWNNKTADWGIEGNTDDNPRLDIDNTTGSGPENVNHSQPENGLDYAVGVYYFADNGFGAAYATVRIYIRGELRFEVANTYIPEQGYFWEAATIRWPSAEVIRRDRVEFGFPNRN